MSRTFNEEGTVFIFLKEAVFFTNGAGKQGIHMQKNEVDP